MTKPKNKESDDPRQKLITDTRESIDALWRLLLRREHRPMAGGEQFVEKVLAIALPLAEGDERADLLRRADDLVRVVRDETTAIVEAAARAAILLAILGENLLPTGWSIDAGRRLAYPLWTMAKAGDLPPDAERELRPLLDDAKLWLGELERRIEATGKPTNWVPASRYRDKTDSRVSSATQVRRFAKTHNVPMRRPAKGRVKLLLDDDAMRRAMEGNRRAAWGLTDYVQKRAADVRAAKEAAAKAKAK